MKITCLGTGSPEPHIRRASSGYLVEVGNDKILLDCGGGVVTRLIESGRLPSDITHLFFSHLHSDHMMDYARLVHCAWDEGSKPLLVLGPKPIAKITERLFGRDGVFAADLKARTELQGSQDVWVARGGTLPRHWPKPLVREIKSGFSFEGDGWTLSSVAVPHAQPLLECMAFRIEANDKCVVYSGDTAICPEMSTLSQGADLLIHWCYRLSHETKYAFITKMSPSAVEIAEMAQSAGVKSLLLTHIRKHMDLGDHLDLMLKEGKESFNGSIDIAEDLMVINL